MQHFPIFLDLDGKTVVVSGGGEAALAKLRLLLKTTAFIQVFAEDPAPEIHAWARSHRLKLHQRPLTTQDMVGATLVYGADEDSVRDAAIASGAREVGVLFNIVDNLQESAFITPAIVDRDPVTVAIGTEGAAPVLARAIKAELEEHLPRALGSLARIGKSFRKMVNALPFGAPRRAFWSDYYFGAGPKAFDAAGEALLTCHAFKSPRRSRCYCCRTWLSALEGAYCQVWPRLDAKRR